MAAGTGSMIYDIRGQTLDSYLSCVPPVSSVGDKDISISVAAHNITFYGILAGRCSPGFYGRLNELCTECWHFLNSELSSSTETADEDKKIYAVDCTGIFLPGFGTEEPVAKRGFALLPPPECIGSDGCSPPPGIGFEQIPNSCISMSKKSNVWPH